MSETHLSQKQSIEIDNYTFFSHNRQITHKRAPKTFGGVGTLVKNVLFNWYDICVFDKCIDGIIGMKLVDKISKCTLIVYNCYLPPINSVYSSESVEFFNHLTQQLYLNADAEMIIICGDFNGRVGNVNDVIEGVDNIPLRRNLDDTLQGHGEELLNFIKDNRLCMLNGRFMSEYDNFTYISDKGKSVVDYIITPQDCFVKCVNFEVLTMNELLQKFNLMDMLSTRCKASDHSVLRTKFNFANYLEVENMENTSNIESNVINQCGSMSNHRKYRFDNVPVDFMLNDQFQLNLYEIVASPLNEGQSQVDNVYSRLCESILCEMDQHLKSVSTQKHSFKPKKVGKPYLNRDLHNLWKDMNNSEKNFIKFKGPSTIKESLRQNFIQKRRIFDKALKNAENMYYQKVVNDIENVCTSNPREFWNFVKNLGPRNKKSIPVSVYDNEGNLTDNVSVVLSKWQNDFSSLLNRPEDNSFDNLFFQQCIRHKNSLEKNNIGSSEMCAEISVEELRSVLRHLKNKKAPGIDIIPNEILKMESILVQLHSFINKVFECKILPTIWSKAIISPIPKCPTKDPNIPLNYRGISLLCSLGKVFTSCINKKINEYCEVN